MPNLDRASAARLAKAHPLLRKLFAEVAKRADIVILDSQRGRAAQVLAVILDMAREAQARIVGRAEVIAEASTHALDLIRKARDARRTAADAASDPSRLRDDDGFRGTDVIARTAFEPIR